MIYEEWSQAQFKQGYSITEEIAFAAGASSRDAEIAELVAALEKAIEFVPAGYGIERECWSAIHATPAQSLARIRNQVREECAELCAGTVCGSQGFAGPSCCILSPGHAGAHSYGIPMTKTQRECAAAILAIKEPE